MASSSSYSSLKRLARSLSIPPKNLLALSPQNDPFYVGAPKQLAKAKWFAQIYTSMGSPSKCHIRRVHYWLVTTNSVPKPNGQPYQNTNNDWGLLCLASKYARYLGLVPIDSIIDRRNPDPLVNIQTWEHRTPYSIASSFDESSIIDSIVDQFWCYNPHQTQPYMLELWCFTPETEVQTIIGPKPISQVKVGDLVLTHRGRYMPVVNTMVRQYEGEINCIDSRYSANNVRVTPNHRILAAHGRNKGILDNCIVSPEWINSSDLLDTRRGAHYVGDYVAFPRLRNNNHIVPVIEPDETNTGRKDGRGGKIAAKINQVAIDDEVAWMLGYFVGNGFVGARSLTFTLNARDEHYATRLIEIGRRFGIEPTKSIYTNTAKVKYNTIRLCKWFKDQFGGESLGRSHTGSWNKRIPQWVIEGPDNISSAFLQGLWDADGTERKDGHKSIVTCSSNVASGIRLLLTKFGEFTTVTRTKDNHMMIRWGGRFTWALLLSGKLSDEYLWFPLKSITKEHYSGPVHNIEVAEDNSYVTEFVVHNCEKSTMNDVIEPICSQYGMNLVTGLGELSITSVHLLSQRILQSSKPTRIFYISDFDPAGECMPVSVGRKVEYFVSALRSEGYAPDVKLIPLLLTSDQCISYRLPRTPIKESEMRKSGFESRHGVGATELDALEALHPGEMRRIIEEAVAPYFDVERWNEAVRQNRAIMEEVRAYLLGAECEECEGKGTIVVDKYNYLSTGEEAPYESVIDCGICGGTGKLPGRIRTDILSDLEIDPSLQEEPDSASPINDDSPSWLYDSTLEYNAQIRRYRRHQKAGSSEDLDIEELDELDDTTIDDNF